MVFEWNNPESWGRNKSKPRVLLFRRQKPAVPAGSPCQGEVCHRQMALWHSSQRLPASPCSALERQATRVFVLGIRLRDEELDPRDTERGTGESSWNWQAAARGVVLV